MGHSRAVRYEDVLAGLYYTLADSLYAFDLQGCSWNYHGTHRVRHSRWFGCNADIQRRKVVGPAAMGGRGPLVYHWAKGFAVFAAAPGQAEEQSAS